MADPQFTTDATAGGSQSKSKSKGCWFYGCITVAILTVAIGIGAVLTVRYVANKIQTAVHEYAQPEPLKLPEVRLTQEQRTDLRQRSETFKTSLEAPKPTAMELVLTGDELNGLLSDLDRSGGLARSLRVKIEGDVISGMISVPLSSLGLTKGENLFLNGEAGFLVTMVQGNLRVVLKEFRLKGQPLPPAIMAGLQNINLAEQYNNNPESQKLMSKLDTVEVRDGKLIIRAKGQQP